MSTYNREETLLLDAAVSVVQRQALVTADRIDITATTITRTFVVEDMRSMGGTLSREEALEQLMEWCGRELAAIRAAPPPSDRLGGLTLAPPALLEHGPLADLELGRCAQFSYLGHGPFQVTLTGVTGGRTYGVRCIRCDARVHADTAEPTAAIVAHINDEVARNRAGVDETHLTRESCSQCGAEVLGYHRCEAAQ